MSLLCSAPGGCRSAAHSAAIATVSLSRTAQQLPKLRGKSPRIAAAPTSRPHRIWGGFKMASEANLRIRLAGSHALEVPRTHNFSSISGFLPPLVRERHVTPSGEDVALIEGRLPVAHHNDVMARVLKNLRRICDARIRPPSRPGSEELVVAILKLWYPAQHLIEERGLTRSLFFLPSPGHRGPKHGHICGHEPPTPNSTVVHLIPKARRDFVNIVDPRNPTLRVKPTSRVTAQNRSSMLSPEKKRNEGFHMAAKSPDHHRQKNSVWPRALTSSRSTLDLRREGCCS